MMAVATLTPSNPLPQGERKGFILTMEGHNTKGFSQSAENTITSLRQSEKHVEKAFQNVSDSLDHALSITNMLKFFCRKECKALEAFKSKWKTHCDKYTELAWESRTVAGKIRTTAKDFCGSFLQTIGNSNIPLLDRKEETARLKETCDLQIKGAQKLSQGFKILCQDVITFGHDIEEFFSRHQVVLKAEKKKVMHEMEKVKERLEKAQKLADSLIRISDVKGAAVTKWLNTLVVFCPSLWSVPGVDKHTVDFIGKIAGAAIHGSGSPKQQKLLDKFDRIKHREEGIDYISQVSSVIKSDIDFIQAELVVFEYIWATVSSDLVEIETILQIASQTTLKDRLLQKSNEISATYSNLVNALREYETKISTD